MILTNNNIRPIQGECTLGLVLSFGLWDIINKMNLENMCLNSEKLRRRNPIANFLCTDSNAKYTTHICAHVHGKALAHWGFSINRLSKIDYREQKKFLLAHWR